VTIFRSEDERRESVVRFGIRIRTGSEQRIDNGNVAILSSDVERRYSVVRRGLLVCTGSQQRKTTLLFVSLCLRAPLSRHGQRTCSLVLLCRTGLCHPHKKDGGLLSALCAKKKKSAYVCLLLRACITPESSSRYGTGEKASDCKTKTRTRRMNRGDDALPAPAVVPVHAWSVPVVRPPRSRHVFPTTHLFPVACWTCHYRTSSRWLTFRRRLHSGENAHGILNDLGITRACCRCIFLTHVDMYTPRVTNGQIFM
jgi:DNA-directed RNA polymerase subunit N